MERNGTHPGFELLPGNKIRKKKRERESKQKVIQKRAIIKHVKCKQMQCMLHLYCNVGLEEGTDNKERYIGFFYFIFFFLPIFPTSATESEVAEMSIVGFEQIHLRHCFTS